MQNKPAYLDLPDLTSEAAAFAARWWTDQLKGPSWNNGEPVHGMFGRMLQESSKKNLVEEDFATFEEILRTEILTPTKIGERETGEYAPKPGVIEYGRAHQDVDYHPSGVLRDALQVFDEKMQAVDRPKAASSLENMFPVKTHVRLCAVGATTALGYGSPHEMAWNTFARVSEDSVQIIDRLRSRRMDYEWQAGNGETNVAKLYYVSLDKEAIIPTIAVHELKGIAKADLYGRDLEEPLSLCGRLAYAFSTLLGEGYLALGIPR